MSRDIWNGSFIPNATTSSYGLTMLTNEKSDRDDIALTPLGLTEALEGLEARYDVGQWVHLSHVQEPGIGFEELNGQLLPNAREDYILLYDWLLLPEQQWLIVTEGEWHDLQAETILLNDGKTNLSKWNGVGGVTKYVVDIDANTIRLPDIRGMFAGSKGYDNIINTGETHVDTIRNIAGSIVNRTQHDNPCTGPFYETNYNGGIYNIDRPSHLMATIHMDVSRQIPTGNAVKPRGYGVLSCVFTGAKV